LGTAPTGSILRLTGQTFDYPAHEPGKPEGGRSSYVVAVNLTGLRTHQLTDLQRALQQVGPEGVEGEIADHGRLVVR